ncbi:MAG TPA: CBS domain-containing protein [Gammaproteobacteria bacterium]|nr:CBS domain-containing protein [Gammaproteobacteria bacterium]
MANSYLPLQLYRADTALGYFRPNQELPDHVTMDSPAMLVMTDLRQVTAVTVEANVSIDWALGRMKESGVRLLLVADSHDEVQGLITSTDIQGEKPMQLLKDMGGQRAELRVRDIMIPAEALEVMRLEDVLKARVGDVVVTLKRVGRRHALVEDIEPHSGQPAVRGIFSISQIGKQLGIAIEPVEVATTFAEVSAALNE